MLVSLISSDTMVIAVEVQSAGRLRLQGVLLIKTVAVFDNIDTLVLCEWLEQ